jgi:hypothetical protein
LSQFAEMTTGVVYIHSSTADVCPHVDWAISATLGCRAALRWVSQPADDGLMCATVNWAGPVGTGPRLATALAAWPTLRFEVTEDPSDGVDGERYCYTPELGMWRGATSANGDVVVGEMRLRALMQSGADNLMELLHTELGTAWDEALEPFRGAGEGAEVTWLSRRVG